MLSVNEAYLFFMVSGKIGTGSKSTEQKVGKNGTSSILENLGGGLVFGMEV